MTAASEAPRLGVWAGTTPLDALAGHSVYWHVATRQTVVNQLFISGVGALLALGLITLFDPTLPGFSPSLVLVFSLSLLALSLIYRSVAIRWPRTGFIVVGGVVQPINVGIAAAAAGPYLADSVAQGAVLTAIVTPILFPRLWGNLVLALTCASYGAVLLVQDNPASSMRFVVITAQAALLAALVRWFSDTVFELAGAERAAKAEAEEARAELQVVDKRKRDFLARMSHELRTPLNAIIGFSEVLRDQLVGRLAPKQREYVDEVASSGRHLLELVDDLLDITQVEGGHITFDPTDTRPQQVIESSVALFREQAGRSGITVHVDAPRTLGVIRADERKLKQILLNLLANAFRFTPAGGRVSVEARRTNATVEISVSDTGPGIDPADHDRIFGAYVQADGDHEGTGLGLALARRFAEMHGGRLEVISRPHAGATFLLILPTMAVDSSNGGGDDVVAHAYATRTDVGMWDRGGVLEQLAGEAGLRRFLARVAGTLALGEGLMLLVVAFLPHPPQFHSNWMLIVAAVALGVGAVMLTPGRELSAELAYLVGYGSVIAIAVLVWLAGPSAAPVMASIFVLQGITTFMGLTLRRAVPVLVFIGVAYGLVLSVQSRTAAVLISWLLTMSLITAGAALARWLVNFVPNLAHAERQARTEAEQVNAALIAASRHKGEFLANMSHELRTPLNAIVGFSEVLAERVFGPLNPRQQEYVDDIVASGHHLLDLINDILDLAKADAGRLELDVAACDLRDVVTAAVEGFGKEAAARDIRLAIEIAPGNTTLDADAARLTQATRCIVANAVAFTPQGGRVDVTVAGNGSTASITVADTGPGIDPRDHDRIFAEFEHATGHQAHAGSGIGLALAKCLVELHGGGLTLRSALDAGSVFTLHVPVEPIPSPRLVPAQGS